LQFFVKCLAKGNNKLEDMMNVLLTIIAVLLLFLVLLIGVTTILAMVGIGTTPWTLTPEEKRKLWEDYDGR
jgi:hypothetical protein